MLERPVYSVYSMGLFTRLKFYAKSAVFGSLVILCALYGVVASLALRLVGKEEYAQYTVARAFYYLLSKVLGITITVKNEEFLLQRPSVVVSNHQSALDVFVLGRVFQPGYTVTAKKVLKYFPFLGWFMLASGTFFLDRAKGEKARKVLDTALHNLKKQHRSIFMFPEGTRLGTKKLEMLPFKKGAFHLAKQAQIPVVPVAVSNYLTIFHSGDMVFNRGEIVVEVLKPMATTDLKSNDDVTAFAADVRDKMLHSVELMGYAPVRGQHVADVEVHSDDSVEIVAEDTPLISGD